MQEYWHNHEEKSLKAVAEEFGIAYATAKKYLHMTEDEIKQLDQPRNYKKRTTIMDPFLNIIYKMMADGVSDDLIYFYVISKGYSGNRKSLWNYIYCIEKNNFPDRIPMNPKRIMGWVYPEDVVTIKRNDLLRYLLTVNPKTKKDRTIETYIEKILDEFEIARTIKDIFCSFHRIIMGEDPTKLDDFLEKYGESKISSFCNGIKKDIAPVKNAISYDVSSGFVEGNNNKFKLLKRIVYGRSGLVNLEKKCRVAFMSDCDNFSLSSLI